MSDNAKKPFGDWQTAYSGRRFWPLDMQEETVAIEDIAHALSLVNRYGGHTTFPVSVAHHSVLVSQIVSPKHAIEGLLHDAHEAYLGDTPKPRKAAMFAQLPEGMVTWREIERRCQNVIYRALGLPHLVDVESPEVKHVDTAILGNEHRDCFQAPFDESCVWMPKIPPVYGVTMEPWSPRQAELEFLRVYIALRATIRAEEKRP